MSLEQLAALGELVGGLGVIATLLFLALEVRSNSRILRANAKTAGMESFANYNEMIATDPFVAPIIQAMLRGEGARLDEVERFRFTAVVRALIQRMEAQYFQYVEGLVDEAYWTQRRVWLKGFLENPALQEWWELEARSAQVTEEFVRHINSTPMAKRIGIDGRVVDDG